MLHAVTFFSRKLKYIHTLRPSAPLVCEFVSCAVTRWGNRLNNRRYFLSDACGFSLFTDSAVWLKHVILTVAEPKVINHISLTVSVQWNPTDFNRRRQWGALSMHMLPHEKGFTLSFHSKNTPLSSLSWMCRSQSGALDKQESLCVQLASRLSLWQCAEMLSWPSGFRVGRKSQRLWNRVHYRGTDGRSFNWPVFFFQEK